MHLKRIVFFIPYFGDWPVWMNHWVETCRANKSIDWILFSDAEPPENRAPNVRHVTLSFADYTRHVSRQLGINFDPPTAYKLCDIRPALGLIHADLARGYDFIGYGDLDVIYGNLRAFLDDATLDQYDVLSTHADRISGHLCLLRNAPEVVESFRLAPSWRTAMERADYAAFDEQGFYQVFKPPRRAVVRRWRGTPFRVLLREFYSTPGLAGHMKWYWEGGRLTNEYYPQHPFMYLHFMSWHSNRWYSSQRGVAADSRAPWSRLDPIVRANWRDARTEGFIISPDGITELVSSIKP